MDLSGFVDIDVKNEDAMQQFLDANALIHQTVHNAILETSVVVDQYPMWAPAGADPDWLLTHDTEHRAWAAALSIGNYPGLSDVDAQNPDEMADWLYNHQLQHQLVDQALGL